MTAAPASHRRATVIALVAPVALFGGFRFLADFGPAPAPAAVPVDVAPPHVPAFNAAQRRAIDWLAAFTLPRDLRSPMIHPEPEPEQIVERPRDTEPAADPAFAVKTIMGTGARAIVSINGRAYRLGGQPVPGWRITAIDGPAKRVTLTGPGGRSIELSPAERKPTGD
jgi:hypothetical protein